MCDDDVTRVQCSLMWSCHALLVYLRCTSYCWSLALAGTVEYVSGVVAALEQYVVMVG